jgi:hypothetical protein
MRSRVTDASSMIRSRYGSSAASSSSSVGGFALVAQPKEAIRRPAERIETTERNAEDGRM